MSGSKCQWSMEYKIAFDAKLQHVAIVDKVRQDYPDCTEIHVSNEGDHFKILVRGEK